MISLIKELFSLLSSQQVKSLIRLQGLVVLMSFAEVFGVASVGPFMALISDASMLEGQGRVAQLYRYTELSSPEEFIFYFGLTVIFILSVGTILSVVTTWRLSILGSSIGYKMGDDLYRYYLNKPWLFHARGNSAHLTKQISSETSRVTNNIIAPLMQMNAKIIMCLFMLVAICILNPRIALIGGALFGCSYVILFRTVRSRLNHNGKEISKLTALRYKLINEGFGGVKDILLLGRQQKFINQFEVIGKRIAYAQGSNKALTHIPRYFMELMAFGSIIFLILFLLKNHSSSVVEIIPLLGVYALAGMKILPAFQLIYASVASIKGNQASYEAIKLDLIQAKKYFSVNNSSTVDKIIVNSEITLKDVQFKYTDSTDRVIDGLNLTIKKNQIIGVVGPSGSGKSTTIDMLLALIEPDEGDLFVDSIKIDEINRRGWQNNIGFVSQSIFLADASIAENIAFGLPADEIDKERISNALRLSHLDGFVSGLRDGINTRVGERGVQLSGGQRQRIGIARALYSDVGVLVFDEATSSLDGITERLIMDAIDEFAGKKTIMIVAHRLSTIRQCDVIYFIEKGKIADYGSYDELLDKNEMFRLMAKNS